MLLTGLRSLGLRQSATINIHPDCSGTLHRILNAGVPDPFFSTPTQKKKRSGYARLIGSLVSGRLPASSPDFTIISGVHA